MQSRKVNKSNKLRNVAWIKYCISLPSDSAPVPIDHHESWNFVESPVRQLEYLDARDDLAVGILGDGRAVRTSCCIFHKIHIKS